MYCAKCGSQINLNLNYCNNCDAKTAKVRDDDEGKVSPLNALITTLSIVALGGLGILVGLIVRWSSLRFFRTFGARNEKVVNLRNASFNFIG
jgi:hypothetical protein